MLNLTEKVYWIRIADSLLGIHIGKAFESTSRELEFAILTII